MKQNHGQIELDLQIRCFLSISIVSSFCLLQLSFQTPLYMTHVHFCSSAFQRVNCTCLAPNFRCAWANLCPHKSAAERFVECRGETKDPNKGERVGVAEWTWMKCRIADGSANNSPLHGNILAKQQSSTASSISIHANFTISREFVHWPFSLQV